MVLRDSYDELHDFISPTFFAHLQRISTNIRSEGKHREAEIRFCPMGTRRNRKTGAIGGGWNRRASLQRSGIVVTSHDVTGPAANPIQSPYCRWQPYLHVVRSPLYVSWKFVVSFILKFLVEMAPSIGVNLRVTGHLNQGGRKYMEDVFCVAYQQTEDDRDLEYAFFGIFDGHGGREAAAFAKEHLMDNIVSQKPFWSNNDEAVLKAIHDGFIHTHKEMWKELDKWPRTASGLPSTSGTTASIAFIRRGKIYIGHVGDSAIVLGQQIDENTWGGERLTRDHKPELQSEKDRISQSGGKVAYKSGVPRVVWNRPKIGHKGPVRRSTPIDEIPFLAVARALGDLWSYNSTLDEFVVSPEPDVYVLDIDLTKHRCLILGTDGLWNMLTPQNAVNIAAETERHNEKHIIEKATRGHASISWLNPSKRLVDRAIERWNSLRLRADNTSCVTVMLDPPGPPKSEVLLRQYQLQKNEHQPFLPSPVRENGGGESNSSSHPFLSGTRPPSISRLHRPKTFVVMPQSEALPTSTSPLAPLSSRPVDSQGRPMYTPSGDRIFYPRPIKEKDNEVQSPEVSSTSDEKMRSPTSSTSLPCISSDSVSSLDHKANKRSLVPLPPIRNSSQRRRLRRSVDDEDVSDQENRSVPKIRGRSIPDDGVCGRRNIADDNAKVLRSSFAVKNNMVSSRRASTKRSASELLDIDPAVSCKSPRMQTRSQSASARVLTRSRVRQTDLMNLRIKDLRSYLNENSISTRGCAEKRDLVDLILENFGCGMNRSNPTDLLHPPIHRAPYSMSFNGERRENIYSQLDDLNQNSHVEGDLDSIQSEDNQIEAVVNESLISVHSHVNMEDGTVLAMDQEMQTNMLQGDNEDLHLHHQEGAVQEVRHDLQTAQNAFGDTATTVARERDKQVARSISLSDLQCEQEVEKLSAKECKVILTLYRVSLHGLVEKQDLVDLVKRLWRDKEKARLEAEELPDSELCKICMAAPMDCVLLECGHMATCTLCGKQMSHCPICQQIVLRAIHVVNKCPLDAPPHFPIFNQNKKCSTISVVVILNDFVIFIIVNLNLQWGHAASIEIYISCIFSVFICNRSPSLVSLLPSAVEFCPQIFGRVLGAEISAGQDGGAEGTKVSPYLFLCFFCIVVGECLILSHLLNHLRESLKNKFSELRAQQMIFLEGEEMAKSCLQAGKISRYRFLTQLITAEQGKYLSIFYSTHCHPGLSVPQQWKAVSAAASVTQPRVRMIGHVHSSHLKVENVDDTVEHGTTAKSGADSPSHIQRDELDLSFTNTIAAFKSKTTWEVFRGWLVFTLCSSSYLVDHNPQLMKLGQKLLGKKLFAKVMKASFYGHFVAGENPKEVKPMIDRMRSFGVKSILDYSAEEDLSSEEAEVAEMMGCLSAAEQEKGIEGAIKRFHVHREFADRRYQVTAARTFFYRGEAQCEKNMEIFLKCIDNVSHSTKATGFAAIKLTALGRPQLLLQLSEVIVRARLYFREVIGDHPVQNGGNIIKEAIKPEELEEKFEEANIRHTAPVQKFLDQLTYDRKGLINLFSWSGLIHNEVLLSELFRVPNLHTGRWQPLISALSDDEEEMFRNMMRRLHNICQFASERDVRVMIDAEQSYFQPAISRLTIEMMREYNRERAILFNTYQCYLKAALENIKFDLEQAERQGFFFGAKIVRGAYMEQERARAAALGYDDPINPTYEATSAMYHEVLMECLNRIKRYKDAEDEKRVAVMVATHNEDSVRFTVQKMLELGIHPLDRVVCFGQLYGMCDQVSFPLGQAGYSVYKYVPYGPVYEVLPYLSRRAAENKGVLEKVQKERRLLGAELRRRLLNGQIFYTPKGNYAPA
ncbi:unnamed protein product [Darwinula stevensoni]|uniref:Proline dehydrogenase 1, mitochondrial n=1 Tax=Darwinula stevensoni TaxID=69355 RepID=A0A7R9ABG0_9CRUS|nr:unnamed protein product [Darwinula stevensoni]CAG0898934.1 unnamed protein product [Darwinula stevensoni]